jgi:hypothetical protein
MSALASRSRRPAVTSACLLSGVCLWLVTGCGGSSPRRHTVGDLIAPDELTGNVYGISPTGHASLIANSGLAHGQDIGTESEGFVPARYTNALVSDRGTPHNAHAGDNEILALPQRSLRSAGVAPGDLLVVNQGGAGTIAVRCRSACRVRHVATGPAAAHIEGHVVFSRAP